MPRQDCRDPHSVLPLTIRRLPALGKKIVQLGTVCIQQLMLPRQPFRMFQWDMASTTISLHLRCRILPDTVYKRIDQQQSNSLPRMACKTNLKSHLTTNYLFLRGMAGTQIPPYAAQRCKILLHTAAKLCKCQQQKKE
jgi:hypothetical protein